MNQKVVQRLRQIKRRAGLRRQDMLLVSVSILAHLIALAVLPGFVVYADVPRGLSFDVELAPGPRRQSAQHSDEASLATVPAEAESTDTVFSTSDDTRARNPAETPAEGPTAQTIAGPSSSPASAAEPKDDGIVGGRATDEPEALHTNEATSISALQPVAALAEEAEIPVEPTEEQSAESATGSDAASVDAGVVAGVSDRSEEPAPEQQSQTGGGQELSSVDASPDTAGASEVQPQESAPDGEAADEAGDVGPADGPSEHELKLLSDYGDAARRRIRSQARNPERGGSGVVTFEFQVARDGHLIEVRVVRSSGYSNIDNDALEATRAAFNDVHEKTAFPPEVTVASWTFVMSLEYPLY